MNDGFVKVAAATAEVHLNDIQANSDSIIAKAKEAAAKGARIVSFQELALTGYTLQDMFLQNTVLDGALAGLRHIMEATAALDMVLIVGLPYAFKGKAYDCAAVVLHGKVLGIAVKAFLPNYSEFYDMRYFAPAFAANETTSLFGTETPIGPHLLFACANDPDLVFAVEICEDLWVPDTPSTHMALNGATVIFNPSASNEIVGKAKYRHELVSLTSARLIAGYVYASAGAGESTGDVVYSGHDIIAENGAVLAEVNDFGNHIVYADIDVAFLAFRRRLMTTYAYTQDSSFATVSFAFGKDNTAPLDRIFSRSP